VTKKKIWKAVPAPIVHVKSAGCAVNAYRIIARRESSPGVFFQKMLKKTMIEA